MDKKTFLLIVIALMVTIMACNTVCNQPKEPKSLMEEVLINMAEERAQKEREEYYERRNK